MRFLQALTASLALALTPMTLAMDTNFLLDRTWRKRAVAAQNRLRAQQDQKRSAKDALPAKSPFLNPKSAKFAVNGTGIPLVHWDVGESYAGQLPIDGKGDSNLFFWFFPTLNTSAPQEIVIWLNGGPGCSSLEGFLQENGPISWQPGTFGPVKNAFSWHTTTNVVWIEQPVGTGFSTGTVTAKNEEDVAVQFMGFWKNFVDTFGLSGYKVYITGESYAGMYCPYIAKAFLDAKDTSHYNLKGMIIYDPVISDFMLGSYIPTRAHVEYWSNVIPLNDTAKAWLQNASARCGFDDYMDKYLRFPPPGPQPFELPGYVPGSKNTKPLVGCLTQDYVADAAMTLNPGFNPYQVAELLPVLDDVLGFPGSFPYTAPGQQVYFNRPEVKAAIHAPANVNWSSCTDSSVFVNDEDTSNPSSLAALPRVIDGTQNVIIVHGMHDFVLIPNGTLLGIQNMTWGGKLGFQAAPREPLFVPRHPNKDVASMSGEGVLGTTHSERGLTWAAVMLTGHMVPQWQAAVAFRQLELMLGRVDSLSSTQPLGLFPNVEVQPRPGELGGGTAPKL